jgi:hypothetical protein
MPGCNLRGASHLYCLEWFIGFHSTTHFVDDVSKFDTHGNFDESTSRDLPARAKTWFGRFIRADLAEASAPLLIIQVIFAQVSTLFMFVGHPHKPLSAG